MTQTGGFANTSVVVTGGGSGIGRATAVQFAGAGATVAVSDINAVRAEQTVSSITEAGGDAFALTADATDPDAVERAVDRTMLRCGQIDVLVNSLGIFYHGSAVDISPPVWRRVVSIDLDGVFFWCQAVARAAMIPAGRGAIVNISSTAGLLAGPGSAPYTAAKHGVIGLTKALAVEWGPLGLRVNAICPGLTATEMVDDAWRDRPAAYADRLARIPSGKSASADDQANAILFLASSRADAVNGLIMAIDGGTSALSSGYSVNHPPKNK